MKHPQPPTPAYHGGAFFSAIGEDFQTLERRSEVINADVLDAWFDPSPKVIEKLEKNLSFSIKTSPPTHSEGLLRTIASARGIAKENVLVSGGSSDLMFTFFPRVIGSNDHILILDPMYGEYAHIFQHVAKPAQLHRHRLNKESQFLVDEQRLKKDLERIQPSLFVIVNPNSPTGQYWDSSAIVKLCKQFPNTLFFVDETYIEYVGAEHSLEKSAVKTTNLAIIKSMSKVYALSGARVGYMVMHRQLADRIRSFIPPWSVSLIGQIAGVEALNDPDYYQWRYNQTHTERSKMAAEMRTIPGIQIFDSVANYLLVDLLQRMKADELVSQLRKKKIFIRNCDSTSIQFRNTFVRMTVCTADANKKIVAAVKEVLC